MVTIGKRSLGLARVDTLLLLGVVLDRHLLFTPHVTRTLAQTVQSTYPLKVLKSHGLPMKALDAVYRATLIARLLYTSPCWWGAVSAADRARLQSALNRVARWGLCHRHPSLIVDFCRQADHALFSAILLRPLLPPHDAFT